MAKGDSHTCFEKVLWPMVEYSKDSVLLYIILIFIGFSLSFIKVIEAMKQTNLQTQANQIFGFKFNT